jgi:hypothetical protein
MKTVVVLVVVLAVARLIGDCLDLLLQEPEMKLAIAIQI